MRTVSVHEAKTHLSKLLRWVLGGEEIIITTSGKPVAKLVTIKENSPTRAIGIDGGKGKISDDFDAPLPKGWMKYFE